MARSAPAAGIVCAKRPAHPETPGRRRRTKAALLLPARPRRRRPRPAGRQNSASARLCPPPPAHRPEPRLGFLLLGRDSIRPPARSLLPSPRPSLPCRGLRGQPARATQSRARAAAAAPAPQPAGQDSPVPVRPSLPHALPTAAAGLAPSYLCAARPARLPRPARGK